MLQTGANHCVTLNRLVQRRYLQDRSSSGARRAFATLPLAKPSLLTYPVSTGLARNVDPPRVTHGEAYGSQGAAVMAMQMCPPPPLTGARAPPMRRALIDEHDCGQPFCGPALLLSNVPLGETGELEVPAEDLPPDWATGAFSHPLVRQNAAAALPPVHNAGRSSA